MRGEYGSRLEVEQLIFERPRRDHRLDNFARQMILWRCPSPQAEAWKRNFVI